MYRMRERTLSEISNVHYGFMSARGTMNAISVLSEIGCIVIVNECIVALFCYHLNAFFNHN